MFTLYQELLGTNMQYLYNKIQSPTTRNLESKQVVIVYLLLSFYNRHSGTNSSLKGGAEMNLIYIPAIPKRMKLLYTRRKCLAVPVMEGLLELGSSVALSGGGCYSALSMPH